MSESRFFLRRLSVYSVSALFDRAGFLLLLPVFIYHFSPEDYGQITLGMVTASFLLNICDPGLSLGFMRYYDDAAVGARREQFSTYFWGIVCFTIAVLIVFLPLQGRYHQLLFGTGAVPGLLHLVLLYVMCNIICYAVLILFRIEGKPGHYLVASLFINVFRLVIVYAGILALRMGVTGTFFGLFLANALTAIGLVWLVRRQLRWCVARPLLKRYLRFGLPLAATGLAFCGLELLDRLLLKLLTADSALVGIYDLNYKLAALMLLLITPLQMLWPEYVYKRQAGTDIKAYRFYIMLLSFAWLLITVFSPYVFLLRPVQAYHAGPELIALLALAYVLYGLNPFFSVGFHREKKTGSILVAAIVALIGNAVLNYFLIPPYQLLGAAVATVVAYLLLLTMLLLLRHRAGITDIEHMAAWRGVGWWLAGIIAVWAIFYGIEFPWPGDLVARLMLVLPFVIVLMYQYGTTLAAVPVQEQRPDVVQFPVRKE